MSRPRGYCSWSPKPETVALLEQVQQVRIELWCEAAGMGPGLARAANPYGVDVFATGGFPGVTATHQIAARALQADVPTLLLHVGDFDPSGESIFDAISQDAAAFVFGHRGEEMELDDEFVPRFVTYRVALLAEHVDEYGLETAPPKPSDSRSRNWIGETCQLEAMRSRDLLALIRTAIEDALDMELAERVRAQGEEEQAEIEEELRRILEEGGRG